MGKKMLAAVFTKIKNMDLKEVDFPEATPTNLILKIDACGLCGSDVRVYFNGSDRVPPPWIMGHEVAGTLIHIGAEAKKDIYIQDMGLQENDRIIVISTLSCGSCEYCRSGNENLCIHRSLTGYPPYPGGYAQYMPVFPIQFRNIFKIPEGLSAIQATLADPLSDALHGINILDIQIGDTVVIMGSGPIGAMHAALASLRGAARVLLADISENRLRMSQEVLAGFARIEYIKVPEKADQQEELLNMKIGKKGAEKIIVASASPEAQEYSLRLSKKRANIMYFGGLPPSKKFVNFESNILHYGEQIVQGSYASKYAEQKLALELIDLGMIPAEKIINHISSLPSINEGFALIGAGEVMKVVTVPHEGD